MQIFLLKKNASHFSDNYTSVCDNKVVKHLKSLPFRSALSLRGFEQIGPGCVASIF